jgi:hypothetical protein
MADTNTITLTILIILAFVWRFLRTRQLYKTSLLVQQGKIDPIPFKPHDLHSFIQGALLGNRSLNPSSFFIRAVVYLIVALCLLPFKSYQPPLIWIVIALIALYVPFCVLLGLLL